MQYRAKSNSPINYFMSCRTIALSFVWAYCIYTLIGLQTYEIGFILARKNKIPPYLSQTGRN